LQDGKPPLDFTVPVPQYPWFHPKDCAVISEVIGPSNCTIYGAFVAGHWTITSLAQNVKIGVVLNLRSRDITHCPGLDDLVEESSEVSKRSTKISPQKRMRSISNVNAESSRAAVRVKFEEDEVIVISSDEECVTIYCSCSSTIQHVHLGLMLHQLVLRDLFLRESCCESSAMQLFHIVMPKILSGT
jgi:hypothetical protein